MIDRTTAATRKSPPSRRKPQKASALDALITAAAKAPDADPGWSAWLQSLLRDGEVAAGGACARLDNTGEH
jgi:hypothetical protein